MLFAFTAVLVVKGTEDWARVTVWKADFFSKLIVAVLEGDSGGKKNRKNAVELSLEIKLSGGQEQ